MPHLRDDGDEAVYLDHDAPDARARGREPADRDDERGRPADRACDTARCATSRAAETAHLLR